jgi:arylsulfatase
MADRLLSLLPSYKTYPNRPLQTARISYAAFDVEDAQVKQQVQKILHGLALADPLRGQQRRGTR